MCREPFSKPRGWLTWGLLGMALSPLVIGITVTIVSYAGYEVSLNLQAACTQGPFSTDIVDSHVRGSLVFCLPLSASICCFARLYAKHIQQILDTFR